MTNIKNVVDSEYKLYINGEWTNGSEGKKIDAINPSNGEKLATFIDATHEDVDAAVEAATEAFKTWKKMGVEERSSLLLKIADLMEENKEKLALVETLDNGKPLRETTNADVPLAIDHFRYFAGVIRSEDGTAKELTDELITITLQEPIGVVGQIVPWNFPLLMAAWKIAPALAAGNTIVFNPSSTTSLSVLEFAKIIDQVLPPGVFNLITGRGSYSGDYMLNHEGFAKLAFTGSTEVGQTVAKAAAERLIPATLELGGKSANIIFDDANFEQALSGAAMGILFNQGQVCSAGSRIFVQEGIYDKFIAALVDKFENVKVGLPWEEGIQMGAQINEKQLNKVLEYIEIGKNEGAKVLTGGERITDGELSKGNFTKPTLLEATNDMRVSQEEIFGPVATVIKFKTEEEVIELANDSEYGLAGAVFTSNLNTGIRVAKGVETGRMMVNAQHLFFAHTPFGGVKKSGIGRETHKTILNAYTQTKNIIINLDEETNGMF